MDSIKYILIKQKQVIQIELGNYILNKKNGITSIHPQGYYRKLMALFKVMLWAIKVIDSMNDDVYQGSHVEQ